MEKAAPTLPSRKHKTKLRKNNVKNVHVEKMGGGTGRSHCHLHAYWCYYQYSSGKIMERNELKTMNAEIEHHKEIVATKEGWRV